jgi:hypothetical protein
LALAIVVLVGAFISMVPRWQMLDHMQKDSRLTSWYWGGGFGGGAGLVVALMFSGVRSPFFAGAALVWLLQCTGYAIAAFVGGLPTDRKPYEKPPARGANGTGLSQGELAELMDVSRQTINAVEAGKYDPSLPLAFKLCSLLRS